MFYPSFPHPNWPPAAMCGQHVLLPCHGLKAGGVTSASLREKISPIPPLSQSGKSVWDSGTNPFWGERRACRWGDDNAPQRGPGAQPRHAFGSFRRETKGTPGVGRAGPLVGAGTTSPAKSPRGAQPLAKDYSKSATVLRTISSSSPERTSFSTALISGHSSRSTS